MTDPNNDWETLASEWQAYQPDMRKINRKTNWVTYRMIAILALDLVILLAYFPFVYYLVILEGANTLEIIWHCVMGVFIVVGVFLDFKIRLPIIKSQGKTTKDILNLYLQRVKAGILIGKIGWQFCLAVLVVFFLWLGLDLIFNLEASHQDNIAVVTLFVCVWLGGIGGLSAWYQKKKQAEYLRLEALWKDLIK
ncbi:hypothetical protein ACUR5C_03800 [Aliikangiella sp. IMCC44653]